MADHDFAIVGTGLMPALLAGCLAHTHGRKVALLAEPSPHYRLPRSLFASFGFWTRPESWALQHATRAEAVRLLGEIGGRQVLWKGSPVIRCHSDAATRAMAHMMHLAGYFGLEMERQADGPRARPGALFRIRGESFVHATLLWPHLFAWLRAGNVAMPETATVQPRRDGSATLTSDVGEEQAARVVLADSTAIGTHAGLQERDRHFATVAGSAILTEPVRAATPLMFEPAMGLSAWQQLSGTMAISGNMTLRDLAKRATLTLGFDGPARRAGEIEFKRHLPADGAPLVGRLAPSRLHVIAGLGPYGLFLMPSVARLLVDEATDAERAYWAPRATGRARKSAAIADFSGPVIGEVAG